MFGFALEEAESAMFDAFIIFSWVEVMNVWYPPVVETYD